MKFIALLALGSVLVGANIRAAEPASGGAMLAPRRALSSRLNAAAQDAWLEGKSWPDAAVNSRSTKPEPLKALAWTARSLVGTGSASGNRLTGANSHSNRSVAEDAFDRVRVSSAGSQGTVTQQSSGESLRLSIDFGSYKGQINTMSVPTRYVPASSNARRASASPAVRKLSP